MDSFVAPSGVEIQVRSSRASSIRRVGYCVGCVGARETNPQFHGKASARCRKEKHVISCKNGDRSNVSKHFKNAYKLVSKASSLWIENTSKMEEGTAKLQQAGRMFSVGREVRKIVDLNIQITV